MNRTSRTTVLRARGRKILAAASAVIFVFILVGCQPVTKTSSVKFHRDVAMTLTFTIDKGGWFSDPDSFAFKLQPTEMSTLSDGNIQLSYSLCNTGGLAYDLENDRTLYIWYTSQNGETSINWETCCVKLKPGECEIKTVKKDGYEGYRISGPLGKLQATTNKAQAFGTLDFSAYPEASGKITFE